jgi:hypothetical protein
MRITLEASILEKLLHHAAFAAHLVGHLDDHTQRDFVGELGDHVDAVVHCLTEILGDPRALAKHDRADESDDSDPYYGAPMITASAGDAP